MRDYHINIFWSDEDDGYIADIPDLEACSAFGATAEEALREVESAKAAWLEATRREGRPIPEPSYHPPICSELSEVMAQLERGRAYLRKPLFPSRPSPDGWRTDACLGFAEYIWDIYAIGYKLAADLLVEYVVQRERDQDTLAYPIGFLYRHCIELRLKELLVVSAMLHDRDVQVLESKELGELGHDLILLWRRVRTTIEEVWPNSERERDLDALEVRLEEFCKVDPGSYSFRYPKDKKGGRALDSVRRFNLCHLRDVVEGISQLLEGCSDGMREYLDNKREMHAYLDHEYGGP
jgi:predicted RNase H-like HicB family nuclease